MERDCIQIYEIGARVERSFAKEEHAINGKVIIIFKKENYKKI